MLLAVRWLHQTGKAVGMQGSQLSLRPKVAPGMVRRKSSPLTTRWSRPPPLPSQWYGTRGSSALGAINLTRSKTGTCGRSYDYLSRAYLPKTTLRNRWCVYRPARFYFAWPRVRLDPVVPGELEVKNIFADCLTHFVALPLHPETVLPDWTWKDPRV